MILETIKDPVIESWLKSNNNIPKIDWHGVGINHTMFSNNEVNIICEHLQSEPFSIRTYEPLRKMNYPVWLWCLGQNSVGWSYSSVCVDNDEHSAILVLTEQGKWLGYL